MPKTTETYDKWQGFSHFEFGCSAYCPDSFGIDGEPESEFKELLDLSHKEGVPVFSATEDYNVSTGHCMDGIFYCDRVIFERPKVCSKAGELSVLSELAVTSGLEVRKFR